jgi:hypothetical protein
MPKNVSGGSGHKAQKNSEGSKSRNNRVLIDTLMDDYVNGEAIDDVFIGRVIRRFGSGRMEVFFLDKENRPITKNIPLRGSMRGKGKKSVWVDLNSLVMIVETGLAGTTHEIVGVLTDQHIARYKKIYPNADQRLFANSTGIDKVEEDGFELEVETDEKEEEDVDVDAI